VVSMD